jgi:hypothetical protein
MADASAEVQQEDEDLPEAWRDDDAADLEQHQHQHQHQHQQHQHQHNCLAWPAGSKRLCPRPKFGSGDSPGGHAAANGGRSGNDQPASSSAGGTQGQQQQQQQLDIPPEVLGLLQPEDVAYNMPQQHHQQAVVLRASSPKDPTGTPADQAYDIPDDLLPFLSPQTLAFYRQGQQGQQGQQQQGTHPGRPAPLSPASLRRLGSDCGDTRLAQAQRPDLDTLSSQLPPLARLQPLGDRRAAVEGRMAALRAEISNGEAVLSSLRGMLSEAACELQLLR